MGTGNPVDLRSYDAPEVMASPILQVDGG